MQQTSSSPSSENFRLAVVQVAPVFLDAEATWGKIKRFALQAIDDGAEVIVWGESLIPGYPGWMNVDSSEEQLVVYARYWDQAVFLDSPLVTDMQAFADSHSVMLVGGIAEREKGSIYATVLTIDIDGNLLGRHRKSKPTWRERLVWADGDVKGLITHYTKIGKIGSLSSSENRLPLTRELLYQQQAVIHVGVWPGSHESVDDITRFIALEGRLWSVAACGLLRWEDFEHLSEDVFPVGEAMRSSIDVLQNGGSQIVAPDGEVIAGPLLDEEGIVAANLTAAQVLVQRNIFDPDERYPSADIVEFSVRRNGGGADDEHLSEE